ncbi:MAG TPA: hypothetical protein VMS86_08130 [Thermoanaerobaculia bacterium]|nr:hypothetical protein [Thermoanaerobaculia bacterium]
MTRRPANARDFELIAVAVARLRAGIMALVFALIGGIGLLVATVWLLVRGGPNVGMHLGLLGNYFPGYDVTWSGAVLGFVYGALTGGLLGFSLAWVYNRLAQRRVDRGARS